MEALPLSQPMHGGSEGLSGVGDVQRPPVAITIVDRRHSEFPGVNAQSVTAWRADEVSKGGTGGGGLGVAIKEVVTLPALRNRGALRKEKRLREALEANGM
ncbi:PREDICTED: uncharacterized protein LOC109190675 [Ipomoea nil]|uniref:uncharacterized protein LOC109190675 n=1 Tax=Ipomoea nil TaxID=35883 RepID=UPI0009019992|nr:PREDICTED: uncharacterized protein LOC109190675 [Ipomoea nil]